MTVCQPVRVFVSYSHDSESHKDRVLELANRLRGEGLDAILDRYVANPTDGWPRWMEQQLARADFVLVICTETYRRRFEGREVAGKGVGATWESLVMNQAFYGASTLNSKLVPAFFDGEDNDHVPVVLRPYTRYSLPSQYTALYRYLTAQPEVTPPEVGTVRTFSSVDPTVTKVPIQVEPLAVKSEGLPPRGQVEQPDIGKTLTDPGTPMFERSYRCIKCGAIHTFLRDSFADKLSELPKCDVDGYYMMPASRNERDPGFRRVDSKRCVQSDGWAMLAAEGDVVNDRKVDSRFIDHWNRTLPRRAEALHGIRGDHLDKNIRIGETVTHETREDGTELWIRFDDGIASANLPRRAVFGLHPHRNELAVAAPKAVPYPGDREQRAIPDERRASAGAADISQVDPKQAIRPNVLAEPNTPKDRPAEVTTTSSPAVRCFVSYSHRDAAWLRRLQVHVKPLVRQGVLELWDDTKIRPGTEWREEIEAALLRASVAILLVSADFLASEYIMNNELPPLLKKAELRGSRILSVIIGPCLFLEHPELSKYQSINPPDRPLLKMTEHDAEDSLLQLARTIKDAVSP